MPDAKNDRNLLFFFHILILTLLKNDRILLLFGVPDLENREKRQEFLAFLAHRGLTLLKNDRNFLLFGAPDLENTEKRQEFIAFLLTRAWFC